MNSDPTSKILFTVDEACEATGIQRSLLYDLVRRGQIPTRKLGRRRLFPVEGLRRWAEDIEPSAFDETRSRAAR